MNHKYSLKANHEISKLVKSKTRLSNKYFVVYYQNKPDLKVAFSVKKEINAVKRNYLKRLARETIRSNLELLKGYLLIIIKKEALDISYLEFSKELITLIKKIQRRQNESNK